MLTKPCPQRYCSFPKIRHATSLLHGIRSGAELVVTESINLICMNIAMSQRMSVTVSSTAIVPYAPDYDMW